MPTGLLRSRIANAVPDWLSWDFWDKSTEGLNHLALIIAGAIGIPLLAIRTFAANRSANASLEQAKAANQSAAAALEQAKTALEQAKTAAARHEEQTKADRERRITESFAKAGEQLGSNKLETRLVGIYTLERIAGESEREYWPIMETLTAFVRENAPCMTATADKEAEPTSVQIRPATYIQAVLTVLGRRDETARKRDQAAVRGLDLAKTDLHGANLTAAHLERANLTAAHLERANLWRAHLEGAYLTEAHLEGAYLTEAHLEGANLREAHLEGAYLRDAHLERAYLREAHLESAYLRDAHLEGAYLWGAHLEGADLREAHLEGAGLRDAHLEGADLTKAAGLTQEQLAEAFGDEKTRVAGELRPPHWPAATPEQSDTAG